MTDRVAESEEKAVEMQMTGELAQQVVARTEVDAEAAEGHEVLPDDVASQIDGLSGISQDLHRGSSMVSASTQGPRCFSSDTLVRDCSGSFVPVDRLNCGQWVHGIRGQPLRSLYASTS